jgi:hypothetical protein
MPQRVCGEHKSKIRIFFKWNKKYPGKPCIWYLVQPTENPGLRPPLFFFKKRVRILDFEKIEKIGVVLNLKTCFKIDGLEGKFF